MFRSRTKSFKVSRRSVYISALQRTNSHGHTTPQSFFIQKTSYLPPVASCFGNRFFILPCGERIWILRHVPPRQTQFIDSLMKIRNFWYSAKRAGAHDGDVVYA